MSDSRELGHIYADRLTDLYASCSCAPTQPIPSRYEMLTVHSEAGIGFVWRAPGSTGGWIWYSLWGEPHGGEYAHTAESIAILIADDLTPLEPYLRESLAFNQVGIAVVDLDLADIDHRGVPDGVCVIWRSE